MLKVGAESFQVRNNDVDVPPGASFCLWRGTCFGSRLAVLKKRDLST